MTTPAIAACLALLCRKGVISGWHRRKASWIVVPYDGPSVRYDRAGIEEYVSMAEAVL